MQTIYIYIWFKNFLSRPTWAVFVSFKLDLLPEAWEFEGSAQYLSCSCRSWDLLEPLPSLGVTAPRAQITAGTTVAFTPHILSSSSFSPWYFLSFSSFFFLMLLSLRIATSVTTVSTERFCWDKPKLTDKCAARSLKSQPRSPSTPLSLPAISLNK